MKDKQLKYLLTLKRKFENIRHDQYQFYEKNLVCKSGALTSSQQHPLSQLYQMINYSLQSLEFKKTINEPINKPKKKKNAIFEIDNENQIKNRSERKQNTEGNQNGKMQIRKIILNASNQSSSKKPITFKNEDHSVSPLKKNNAKRIVLNQKDIDKMILDQDMSSNINQLENKEKFQVNRIKEEKNNTLSQDQENDKQISKAEDLKFQSYKEKVNSNLNLDYLSPKEKQVNSNKIETEFMMKNDILNFQIRNGFFTPKRVLEDVTNQQSKVEIKQHFTEEREEKLEITDIFSNISIKNHIKCSSSKSKQQQSSDFVIIDKEEGAENATEQYNFDQYFNFETPKKCKIKIIFLLIYNIFIKIDYDLIEESDSYERQIIIQKRSNHHQFSRQIQELEQIIQFDVFNIILSTLFCNFYLNKQQLSAYNDQIKFQEREKEEEGLQKTTVKKIITFRNISNDTNSDQTIKYRFQQVDQVEGKEEIQKSIPLEVLEASSNQFIPSNTNDHNSQEERKTISNKKIVQKLDFKKNEEVRSYVRGPYNFYSEELKKKAIRDYHQFKDIKLAAKMNEVKAKNLKRWISVGYKRKEGGGRKKEDPQMEEQVFEWLKQQYFNEKKSITRNQIREKALSLSNKKDKFKASKGWLEKFFARYNCKFMSKKDNFINFDSNKDYYIEESNDQSCTKNEK